MPENMNAMDLANFLQNAVKNNDNLGGNNSILWLFFLFMFMGYGGYGYGNRGTTTAAQLTNDAAVTGAVETAIAKAQAAGVSDQLMLQAVNGNKEALDKLATTLGYDSNQICEALCAIKSSIQGLNGSVELTSQQVVNSIQNSAATVVNTIQSMACDVNNNITRSQYDNQLQTINQTNALNNNLNAQTAMLAAKIDNQTQVINDRFCDLELREQSRIIDRQNADISELKSRISTQEILTAIAAKSTTTTA